jgi:hypothetical protein
MCCSTSCPPAAHGINGIVLPCAFCSSVLGVAVILGRCGYSTSVFALISGLVLWRPGLVAVIANLVVLPFSISRDFWLPGRRCYAVAMSLARASSCDRFRPGGGGASPTPPPPPHPTPQGGGMSAGVGNPISPSDSPSPLHRLIDIIDGMIILNT